MSIATLPSPLLTPEQAAEILGTTVGTLAVWRCRREHGIPYVKIGGSVRYRREDLEADIAAHTVRGGEASPE